jgi:transposase InsO family protein
MIQSHLYEDRKTAIHLLRSGCCAQEVAKQLNRSVSWVHKWRIRFKQKGWHGLQGYSQAPKSHSRRLGSTVRQAIVQARSELEAEAAAGNGLKYTGAPAVLARLDKDQVKPLPSLASIKRVLRTAGMTNRPSKQAKEKIDYPHLRPTQSHQLVQVDIVPHFLLGGVSVACFNAIDVVSRYPTGRALAQRRACDAVSFLIQVWQEIGLPQYTQVDNEGCFSGGFTHKGVLGQVLRLALWVGTELVFSPVRHPESNGTVERFHQEYNRHVWKETLLSDLTEVHNRGKTFFQDYHHSRHHSALHGQTPAEVHYRQLPKPLAGDFDLPSDKLPLTVGRVHFIRRVSPASTVFVLNLEWQVPDPQPNKGVWVTIDFTLAGATLRIYDAAPDVDNRLCLVAYPFPLPQKVQSKQTKPDLPTQQAINLSEATLIQLPFRFLTDLVQATLKVVVNC